jgi:hypothetical protein
MGVNNNSTNMAGAVAWVYTLNDQGIPVLQQRVLANHAPGQLVNPTFPCQITHLPSGSVQVHSLSSLSASPALWQPACIHSSWLRAFLSILICSCSFIHVFISDSIALFD